MQSIGRSAVIVVLATATAAAQEPSSSVAVIERAQAEKAGRLQPHVPGRAEVYLREAENLLTAGLRVHPFFQSAYSGGGFTLGAGYRHPVSAYNTIDLRGSFTFSGYKRLEAEFLAPRVIGRKARLSIIGGWREATQVGYYGLGTATSKDDRANYGFTEFYGLSVLEVRPFHRFAVLRGGVDVSQWEQTPGSGSAPSVDEVYSSAELSGLGRTIIVRAFARHNRHRHAICGGVRAAGWILWGDLPRLHRSE